MAVQGLSLPDLLGAEQSLARRPYENLLTSFIIFWRELGVSLGFFLWMQCLASSETDVLCCDFFVVTQGVEDAIFVMLVLTSMFKLMPGQ